MVEPVLQLVDVQRQVTKRSSSRRAPDNRARSMTLETYCTIGNVDLKRIARKHGISLGTLQYWIESGNWRYIRKRRQELEKTIKQIEHPREVFVLLTNVATDTAQKVRSGVIRADEGKSIIQFVKAAVETLEQCYENLGIKWNCRSNKITTVLKEFE